MRGPPFDLLAERLKGIRALLLLDNLEHVLGVAGDLAALLSASADLAVLATSRTALRVRGEVEWPLGALGADSAAQLFLARAPEVDLTADNAARIAEICRRLDGIPLAIEFAAGWVRVLGLSALLERLAGRLDLGGRLSDVPERQRTLRSTLDWSHELLGDEERALLAWLSVFAGGWTIAAAEAVGAASATPLTSDALTTLSSLVDKSLVTVDVASGSGPRFRFLGVVAEYAAEKLDERGERGPAADVLLGSVVALSHAAAAGLGTSYRSWARRLDDELENVRAAWRHALASDQALPAYTIAINLAYYLWSRSLLPELLVVLDQLVALPSSARLDDAARGRLLWGRAITRIEVGQLDGVGELLEQAVRVGEDLGDVDLQVRALTALSYAAGDEDLEAVRAALAAGVEHLRRGRDGLNTAYALVALAQAFLRSGDPTAAASACEDGLFLARGMDNNHLEVVTLHLLGFATLLRGELTAAGTQFDASIAANENLTDQEGLAYCLDGLAAVTLAEGDARAAARLLGAAARLRDVLGISAWPALRPIIEATTAAVRSALGPDLFREQHQAGAALRPAEAVSVRHG